MNTYSNIKFKSFFTKENRFLIYAFATTCIIVLTIFQDYIYSQLRNTSFYLSESLTYNTFWAFFIPLGMILFHFFKLRPLSKSIFKPLYLLVIGLAFSIIHMLLFTSFFILISNIFFNPPHRFIAILKSVISNHFYIAFIFYALGPFIYHEYLSKNKKQIRLDQLYADKINIKIGTSIKTIKSSSIQLIATDKPYSKIYTDDESFLQDRSLKDFENELDPTLFLRVHRSAIINKKHVTELTSRKNGDYDAILTNGQSVRLSRHYRKKWNALLQLA